MGFDSQNMLIKWEKTGDKTGIYTFNKMTFSGAYKSKSPDGKFQTESLKLKESNWTEETVDIDFLKVTIKYKDSKDKECNAVQL